MNIPLLLHGTVRELIAHLTKHVLCMVIISGVFKKEGAICLVLYVIKKLRRKRIIGKKLK